MWNSFFKKSVVCSALIIFASTACKSNKTQGELAYITNGVASFWVIAEKGARDAGKQLNVPVSVHMPAEGISDQKRIVEDLLTRGVGGIAISLIDPDNQTEMVNQATRQTHVITQDSDAAQSNREVYIGMDNYVAGRMAGELVKESLPEGGKLAIFIGRLEQDNARRRRQGVIDELLDRSFDSSRFDPPGSELKNHKYDVSITLTDQFDRAKAKANVEDIIASHADIKGLIGLFAYNPPAILEAVQQSGKAAQIKVFGFDEAEETLKAIEAGKCEGTIVQNPYQYGYESIRVLKALSQNDRSLIPENRFINIPAKKITRANVTEFWKDLQSKLNQ